LFLRAVKLPRKLGIGFYRGAYLDFILYSCDLPFIFPYIQYPTPISIAKIIKPISTGAKKVTRNITIAAITINAITPITMAPIVHINPITIFYQ
jgi:hypothetical protein